MFYMMVRLNQYGQGAPKKQSCKTTYDASSLFMMSVKL